MSAGMRHLVAEFTVRAGHEERVAGLVRELAREVRREPGNVVFDPFTRREDPRLYMVVEAYRDEAAFTAHLASAHSRAFNAALGECIEDPASRLTWLDPLDAG